MLHYEISNGYRLHLVQAGGYNKRVWEVEFLDPRQLQPLPCTKSRI